MPVASAVVVFVAVMVPVTVAMAVWAAATAFRILVSERADPSPPPVVTRGEGAPVRLHDIVAAERARRQRPAPAGIESDRAPVDGARGMDPLFADLWARRN